MTIVSEEPKTEATLEERCELLLKTMEKQRAVRAYTSNFMPDWEEIPITGEPTPEPPDNVNHPTHYANRKYEVIDVMEDTMTEEQYRGYLLGCAIKYLMRFDKKGKPQEDLQKAKWYLTKLITSIEGEIAS